jgi:hypothetical protein
VGNLDYYRIQLFNKFVKCVSFSLSKMMFRNRQSIGNVVVVLFFLVK